MNKECSESSGTSETSVTRVNACEMKESRSNITRLSALWISFRRCQYPGYIASTDRMSHELERAWKDSYYPRLLTGGT
jgi:hypothetical protein